MQSPSKITRASTSTTIPAVYGLQGWADLPEGLLHSVVPLLGSIIELLAFAGTCRSWRACWPLGSLAWVSRPLTSIADHDTTVGDTHYG